MLHAADVAVDAAATFSMEAHLSLFQRSDSAQRNDVEKGRRETVGGDEDADFIW